MQIKKQLTLGRGEKIDKILKERKKNKNRLTTTPPDWEGDSALIKANSLLILIFYFSGKRVTLGHTNSDHLLGNFQ